MPHTEMVTNPVRYEQIEGTRLALRKTPADEKTRGSPQRDQALLRNVEEGMLWDRATAGSPAW